MAKKLFLIGAMALWAMGVMAQSWLRVADVKGDLTAYNYYYVAPTSPITSSYGEAQTSTVSPSETISGYLMKSGYNVIASIVPEKANQTLFVSYYKDGELVHEQEVEVATNINPSEQQRIYFKRPKEFRSKKLKIRYNVISYK